MDTTTPNPFEPPRTTDLDAGRMTVRGPLSVGSEAERELAAAAPWVSWLARATSVSIAVGLIKGIADVVHSPTASGKTGRLLVVAILTATSTWILSAVRRYLAAVERLRAGDRAAVGQVIAAQAGYFRLVGKLLIPGLGLMLLVALLFVASRLLR